MVENNNHLMAPAGKSSCHWDWCLNEITENLYLGSVQATKEPSTLENLGITHILSLGVQPLRLPNGLADTMFVDVDDHELAEIYPHLGNIVNFIGLAINRGGKVLVHCFAGSSRSGSSVIAYMMASKNWDYFTALRYVQSKR